jgi:hypothetical protein
MHVKDTFLWQIFQTIWKGGWEVEWLKAVDDYKLNTIDVGWFLKTHLNYLQRFPDHTHAWGFTSQFGQSYLPH